MPLKKNIAIIGSGISGLSCAYLLQNKHQITLYEKQSRLGGHSRTVTLKLAKDGEVPVDSGFIVFNHSSYPLLTKLFRHLDIAVAPSHMSFGVSIDDGWLEYSTHSPLSLFAQKRNLWRAQFWRLLWDITRFNRQAPAYLERDISMDLRQALDEMGLSPWFRDYYLLAMGGAIWSTPSQRMQDYPASSFIRFFQNHGLLTLNSQPQWYNVIGGSQEYVKKMTQSFSGQIKTDCQVKKVKRGLDEIEIEDVSGQIERYDYVIFACHSDQALGLLERPSQKEKEILGAIQYQTNQAIMHSDISLMPKRRSAWASWVYLSSKNQDDSPSLSLSYWMNNLQPLQTKQPIFVSLNADKQIDPEKIYDSHFFEHPLFDHKAILAQSRLAEIQNHNRSFYCGAWTRYGFHEDGLMSGVNVARQLGAEALWI